MTPLLYTLPSKFPARCDYFEFCLPTTLNSSQLVWKGDWKEDWQKEEKSEWKQESAER